MSVIRSDKPTVPQLVLYEPALCVVAQGAKEAKLETRSYRYDASHYLLGSVSLPVIGSVIEGCASNPFLCLRLDLDRSVVADLIEKKPLQIVPEKPYSGLSLGIMDVQLLDAIARLADLSNRPEDIEVLAPMIEREIVWHILGSHVGATTLVQVIKQSKNYRTLHDTLAWIDEYYTQPCSCQDLAENAGMSKSKFYSQFKELTGTSPIRYRTRLRMIEARRLMLVEGYDAASAGFMVGYNEPSQFNREYSRFFGVSPKRDVTGINKN